MSIKNHNLAIIGGTPIRRKPWQDNITTGIQEKKAAVRALETGYLSLFEGSHSPLNPFSFWGGPYVQQLEKAWCDYYNCKYAVAVNSATSGLYAAIGALGIGFGDEVIVSPYTMSACASAALVYGAIPIFADVCLETGSLDPVSIKNHITKRTKAILVVHQFGIPADMDGIMALAKKYNLKVIEDCAQAHGAKYKGRYVGTIGDIGVFSLNVNKTIQSGEGGVCVTNNKELRYRLALIRNHGEVVVGQAGYRKITNIIGFNYRITEVTAAIAIEQLKKLNKLNNLRISYVRYLNKALSKYDFLKPLPECLHGAGCTKCKSTYYVYPLRYFSEISGIKREDFVKMLNAEGVLFYQGYAKPLYLLPLYQRKEAFKHGYPFTAPENTKSKTNYYKGACRNAEKLYFEEMMINEHVRFPHAIEDIKDIVKAVDKVALSIFKQKRVRADDRRTNIKKY